MKNATVLIFYAFIYYVNIKLYRYQSKEKKILRGFGPLANYADRATAACWRSSAIFCG
jgi:hypothetical protein